MAPGYRANNQSRRANRSYVDHDVFEGLPVRNWRRDTVTIAPPPIHEISTQKDKWDIELPWGMPKDSHLLPQHSQDLLRAARSGRLYIRRPLIEEEEVDTEAVLGDKPDKKEEYPKEKGFSVKTWKLVPKHQESPEIEFLAKRRKGLTGTAVKTALISGPTVTKARVRRTDAAGNTYLEDVVVAESRSLEGELFSQTVVADSVIGKTAVDAIPPLPTPPRRRPPPPKRKAKGPGRGRKRKLAMIATSVPGEPGGVKPEMGNEDTGVQNDNVLSEGVKREGSDTANNENENEDTEIGDEAINPSDEEGEDGSDEEEDQSEGEGQEDRDEYDVENTDLKHPGLVRTETNESVDIAHSHTAGQDREMDPSSSPELPLAIMGSMVGHEHGNAGSPLRNVVTLAPTLEEHSPDLISDSEAEAEGDDDEVVHDVIHPGLRVEVERIDMQETYHIPQGQSFPAEHIGDVMATEQAQDYMEDDQMLLDGDMSSLDFGTMPSELEQYPEPYLDDDEIMPVLVQERQEHIPQVDSQNFEEPHFSVQDFIADPPRPGPSEGAREDEEDNFEDLLGSLEDHLNEQDTMPMTGPVDGDVTMKEEVAYVPATEQAGVAQTKSEIIEEAVVYRIQDEVPDKQPATEDGSVAVTMDLETKEGQVEHGEVPAPPAAADE